MRRIPCEACAVRDYGICDMPPEAKEEFESIGVRSVYKPHQVLFNEGGRCEGLHLLCHGAVKLYYSDRFGRDHILEVAGPGAVLGELSTAPDGTLSVSAETLTESQLCFLPRQALIRFIEKHPHTGVHLIECLSRELALARRKVRDLALKRADGRLADLLLQFAGGDEPPGKQVTLRHSRQELAEMIGVSTETLIRLLSKLRRDGAIDVQRRTIVLTDVEKLERIAHYEDTDA